MTKLALVLVLALVARTRAAYVDALSYDALRAASAPVLLFVTVRWCDHCRALQPEIRALARAARDSSRVLVARVDADDEPAVPATFGISGFPSILFFPASYDHRDKAARPLEFSDWRWAEVIAEFVNNETDPDTILLEPRDAFLKWRRKHPYNLGKRALEEPVGDDDEEGIYDDGISRMGIREPTVVTADNFEARVLEKEVRFLVLFYTKEDPFIRELLVQWRQASSAFTGAENVTIGFADISKPETSALADRLEIKSTPRCLFFPRCAEDEDVTACKQPVPCEQDMDDTENIIQFLSDRVMVELGVAPEEMAQQGKGKTYRLTEEQYQQMKRDGVVFANDPDQQDRVRELYAKQAEKFSHDQDGRDEL